MSGPGRGQRFTHLRRLDPDWLPGPGQSVRDAPHAVYEVSAVRGGWVYYRTPGATSAQHKMSVAAWDRDYGRDAS